MPPLAEFNIDKFIARLLEGKHHTKTWRARIPENHIHSLIDMTKEIFLEQPSLLRVAVPINIIGDIHGQFGDLLRLLDIGGNPGENNYLFLGDYVDRCDRGIEVLCLLMCYKILYPDNVFLLRGNHESSDMNDCGGFRKECTTFYGLKLYHHFQELFNCLPIAAIVGDKIFCVHGGLSPELKSLNSIASIQRPCSVPDDGLLADLLWSDPSDEVVGWVPSPRDVAYLFGEDIVDEFMNRFDFDLICRAHECVDGYLFQFDRRLVTLFSAPNYCGCERNAGAIMMISEDLTCSFKLLREETRRRNSSIFSIESLNNTLLQDTVSKYTATSPTMFN
ncbi:hypothetical protein WA158_005390 [Blastocystis sp. Blastoise]